MKVKFDDKEFDLKYSMRMLIVYENITGRSLTIEELQNYTNIITLFYAACHSSAKQNNIEFKLTYDEFIDWIDAQGGEAIIVDFANWYAETTIANAQLYAKNNEKGDKEGTKKSRKKS